MVAALPRTQWFVTSRPKVFRVRLSLSERVAVWHRNRPASVAQHYVDASTFSRRRTASGICACGTLAKPKMNPWRAFLPE